MGWNTITCRPDRKMTGWVNAGRLSGFWNDKWRRRRGGRGELRWSWNILAIYFSFFLIRSEQLWSAVGACWPHSMEIETKDGMADCWHLGATDLVQFRARLWCDISPLLRHKRNGSILLWVERTQSARKYRTAPPTHLDRYAIPPGPLGLGLDFRLVLRFMVHGHIHISDPRPCAASLALCPKRQSITNHIFRASACFSSSLQSGLRHPHPSTRKSHNPSLANPGEKDVRRARGGEEHVQTEMQVGFGVGGGGLIKREPGRIMILGVSLPMHSVTGLWIRLSGRGSSYSSITCRMCEGSAQCKAIGMLGYRKVRSSGGGFEMSRVASWAQCDFWEKGNEKPGEGYQPESP